MNPSTNLLGDLALYVVATPIGNLDDLSPRAANVLSTVGLIAAEDTRRTRQLLTLLNLSAQADNQRELIAAHMHNEAEAAGRVLAKLAAGISCALVSDAGTPAISDPGARLVRMVRNAGFRVIPIPGPSAVTTLLCAAGIESDSFWFIGFVPSKANARRQLLSRIADLDCTAVILEAPHRIGATLGEIAQILGPERELIIGRELTKRHEQIVCMAAGDGPNWLASDANHQRGEFVIAITPPSSKAASADLLTDDTLVTMQARLGDLLDRLLAQMPTSQAVKLAQALTGLPHKTLYSLALQQRVTETHKKG